VSQVTVIRDVSGSVENINASNSALKEQLLKQDISHLCKIECLIEELLLRKMAEIDYARQALKKIEVSSAYAYKLHRIGSF
jgi:hypothetical protein